MSYIKWKCSKCKDIVISNTKRHHQMDICKCGGSGLDAEEDYVRCDGGYKFLEHFDYNFFDELVLCMDSQDLLNEITNISKKDGKFWINFSDVMFIRKLEDEIMGGLK